MYKMTPFGVIVDKHSTTDPVDVVTEMATCPRFSVKTTVRAWPLMEAWMEEPLGTPCTPASLIVMGPMPSITLKTVLLAPHHAVGRIMANSRRIVLSFVCCIAVMYLMFVAMQK